MIRPFTCLCLVAAFGSGMYLYTEKHHAQLLDRDIGHVIRATEAARQRTGMLRAEWALLNEPGRLQDMANKYLHLKTMAPTQFVQLADLATRLPAPLPPGTVDEAPSPDAQDLLNGPPPPDAAQIATLGGPIVDQPPAPPPSAPPPPRKLARATPKKPAHPVALASRDNPLAQSAPLPLAAPQPLGARVLSAMAHQTRSPASRQTIVAASPSYLAPAPYNGSALTSAIGGHVSLPPPVPYGR